MGIFTLRSSEQNLWGGKYGRYFMDVQLEATSNSNTKQYTIVVKKAHVYGVEYNFTSHCSVSLGGNTNTFNISASGNNKYSGFLPNSTGTPTSENNWLDLNSPSITVDANNDGSCPPVNLTFVAQNSSVHWIVANKQVAAYVSFNQDISYLIQSYSGGIIDVTPPSVQAYARYLYNNRVTIHTASNAVCSQVLYATQPQGPYLQVIADGYAFEYDFDVYMTNTVQNIYVKLIKRSNGLDTVSSPIYVDNRIPTGCTLSLQRNGKNSFLLSGSAELADTYILNIDNNSSIINSVYQVVGNISNSIHNCSLTPFRQYSNGLYVIPNTALTGLSVSKSIDMNIPTITNIQCSKLLDKNNNTIDISFNTDLPITYNGIDYSQGNVQINNFPVEQNNIKTYSFIVQRNGTDSCGSLNYLWSEVNFEYNTYPLQFKSLSRHTKGEIKNNMYYTCANKLVLKGQLQKLDKEQTKEEIGEQHILYTITYEDTNIPQINGELDSKRDGSFILDLDNITIDKPFSILLENRRKSNNAYTSMQVNNIVSRSGSYINIDGVLSYVTPYIFNNGRWVKAEPKITINS